MIRFLDARDSGKTRKLLEECAKTGGTFVCKHPERIVDKCHSYGIPTENINAVSYYDDLSECYGDVYIDELESFVQIWVNGKLSGYSQTIE